MSVFVCVHDTHVCMWVYVYVIVRPFRSIPYVRENIVDGASLFWLCVEKGHKQLMLGSHLF